MDDLKTLETKLNALIAKGEMIEAVEQFYALVARRARRSTSLTFSRR